MPLLGNRPHILNATAKKSKKAGDEAPTYQYVVPETREICSSEDELKRKTTIYESKIWTCRVTGRANLTYKDAVKSERDNLNLLKQSVSSYHRGPILQIVHKNSSPLEPLTNECWTRVHEQFEVGEPVMLKVDASKPISAIVVSVEAINNIEEIDLTKDETSSPNNSDKENNGGTRRPPLPKDTFSYSVKIDSEEPIRVNNVPSKCMQRVNRAPSKDHIRMFIRAHAMRYGPSSSGPWIVDTPSLKKYCPKLKMSNNLVDKDKLRLLSETYETMFYEKIVSELSKGNNINGETTIRLSPKSLKVFKNISALRDDSPIKAPFGSPAPIKTKELLEKKASKKMKQAVLPFNKSEASPSTRKSKSGTPMRSESALPYIAKRLVRLLKNKPDAAILKKTVIRCAEVLTDPQIRALPDSARKLIIDKKLALEHRKRMQNMTPEQQKAYLRHLRQQRRSLIDENASVLETAIEVKPLPEPRAIPIPSNMTPLQFSRVLSFTEFIACYQPLLTEGALSPGESLYPSQVKKLAADMCQPIECNREREEEEFTTDLEEESALTSTDAGLPRASIQGLRSLSLDRTLRAVVEPHMSASAYRSLARPMSAILRLLFLSEQYSRQTELGIQLSKIPITPYTAPELLRLLLSCELAKGSCSTNDIAIDRIRQIIASSGGNADYLKPPKDALGASSLFKHLSSTDLFDLDVEHRILSIELLVELMLDFDTVDEYLHTCEKKAIQATKERLALSKQERTVIPPELGEDKVEVQKEPELDDLASIVKSRRVLAAKAAEEREMREAKERQRRELEAKIEAEEKALTKAEHDQTVATTESKLAFRARFLGTDRRDRRYWHFFCAPNRLFAESNWAPEEHRVGDNLIIDSCVATSTPPPHLFPEGLLATFEPVHRFGYAARSMWFVFDQTEELDALANSLVENGARESQLKKNLVQSGLLESLKELIALTKVEKSPAHDPMEFDSVSKPSDQPVIEKITAKTRGDAQAILANVLLKNVYETEIHLRDGGLGGVADFPAWMANILTIQAQFGLCFCLTGSVPSTPMKGPAHVVHAPSPSSLKTAVSAAAPNPKTPLQSAAEALVSVGLNVHRRFLSVPKIRLREMVNKSGDQEEDGFEENTHQEVDEKQQRLDRTAWESDVELWIDAWVNAVRSASTLSRLNVLHACLDACILWEKSVANVRCRICRKNKDDESLLLCDGCNAGFHLYCLRPPLHSIPRGDWFCVSCKPQISRSKSTTITCTGRQRRDRLGRDETCEASDSEESRSDATSDSEDESSSSEEVEEGQQMRITRSRTRHHSSTKKTVSRSSSQSSFQSKALSKIPSASNLVNDLICLVCDEEGTPEDELVGCSTCSNAFHLNCHNPPLRSTNRRAPWICSVCRIGRSVSGGLSAIGQSLRLRAHSRVNRKSSYARLHKISATPKKRPRPVSLSEEESSASEESFNDDAEVGENEADTEATASEDDVNEGEEDEEEAGNDTETTEEQAEERDFQPPPSKRPRIASSTIAKSFSCADLIYAVRRHRNSWPFQEPVDSEEVTDYYEIVVDPVDLTMVNNWLKSGRYDGDNGPQRLSEDLAKMFFNAELYNSVDSDVWKAGSQLEIYVQNLFKKFSPPVEYKRDPLN